MDKNKNQGQSNQDKKGGQPNQQENSNKGQSPRGNEPADNNPKSGTSAQQQSEKETQQSGEWKRPLTNQDEQREVTNEKSGGSALGEGALDEEESEGDERLKPYKNIGDDSEETEKKTPTME